MERVCVSVCVCERERERTREREREREGAKCRVRAINLPCRQRFQGSRWGGAGRSPARNFLFFSIFFGFFCQIFKEKKGDVLTNI